MGLARAFIWKEREKISGLVVLYGLYHCVSIPPAVGYFYSFIRSFVRSFYWILGLGFNEHWCLLACLVFKGEYQSGETYSEGSPVAHKAWSFRGGRGWGACMCDYVCEGLWAL